MGTKGEGEDETQRGTHNDKKREEDVTEPTSLELEKKKRREKKKKNEKAGHTLRQ